MVLVVTRGEPLCLRKDSGCPFGVHQSSVLKSIRALYQRAMDVLFESIRALCRRKGNGRPFWVHQSSVSDKGQWMSFWSSSELCAREKDNGCPFGIHQSSVPEKGQLMSFWSSSEFCARERTMDVLLEFIRALCQSPSELYARVHQSSARVHQSSVPESNGCPLRIPQSSVPEKRQWTSFLSPS